MKKVSYVIGSGWWCKDDTSRETEPAVKDGWFRRGDSLIRSALFHKLWYQSINRFTRPEKIILIDSASPVLPPLCSTDPRIELLRLPVNSGHAAECRHQFCGWTKSVLLGLQYAALAEVEYFVYVEQDVLLKGEGIIEHAINQMQAPCMFGSGEGTPQALQQSFFILKTSEALPFLQRYSSIERTDKEMSPEHKFGIACSPRLYKRRKPFLNIEHRKQKKRILKQAAFDRLPFGYGRVRPIDFSKPYFYFQHGSLTEIEHYAEAARIDLPALDIHLDGLK